MLTTSHLENPEHWLLSLSPCRKPQLIPNEFTLHNFKGLPDAANPTEEESYLKRVD